MSTKQLFSKAANKVSYAAGHAATFIGCVAIVIIWAASGPLFGFTDTWQLIINTGTTIVTFLMVFLIQNTQNRDGAAIQAKLDELIRAGLAENAFIGIEHLTEEEVNDFRMKCENAAKKHTQSHTSRSRKIAEEKAEEAKETGEVAEAKRQKKKATAQKTRKPSVRERQSDKLK